MPEGPSRRAPLELRQLRTLAALVDHGSVTAAAHALGLAQSTVSESLTALERALGTAVIVRRRGASEVLLTTAGQALLPYVRTVLATIEDAQIAVAGASTAAHAVVDIVANESVSTYMLPRALAVLRKRWPNVRFTVSVAACAGVRDGVADGSFDLGLLLGERDATAADVDGDGRDAARREGAGAFETRAVLPDVPLVVFAMPGHPLAATPTPRGGTPLGVRRDRLDGVPLFLTDAAGDFHTLVRDFFAADGLPMPHLEPAGSVEGVKHGVAADPLALGLLPVYALFDELRSRRFAPVDVRPALPRMQLDAILSRSRARHPVIAELLDAVQRVFETGPRHGAATAQATPAARRLSG